jgi:hypothetical protein
MRANRERSLRATAIRRSLLLAAIGAVGCSAVSTSAVAVQKPTPATDYTPVEFDVSLFGAGSLIVPANVPLTATEELQLAKQAERMGREFSPYLYSGCQNRALATYLLLPKGLRDKAAKVWVLSPGVYSVGFVGLVGLRGNEEAARAVQWGFHVAVAFLAPDRQLRVLDSGLAPGRVLSKSEWFGLMKIPPLALWTLTKGDVYQFVTTNVEDAGRKAAVNPTLWNGHFREYTDGDSQFDRQQFERELARDAVGAEALLGHGCEAVRKLTARPDELQAALDQRSLVGCESTFQRYALERERLHKLLFAPR